MNNRGFTLIEMLVVLAILGILAAIAIPMYMNSVNRSKQAKTVADMRSLAMAWEARAADIKAYNASGVEFEIPEYKVKYEDVRTMLEPTYIRNMPHKDGWAHDLEFRLDEKPGDKQPAQTYTIRSPGRDGKFDDDTYTVGTTEEFDADIVYANGGFVQSPMGKQK